METSDQSCRMSSWRVSRRGWSWAYEKSRKSCDKRLIFSRNWSGREDLNLRPLEPHSSALPDCATPRHKPSSIALCHACVKPGYPNSSWNRSNKMKMAGHWTKGEAGGRVKKELLLQPFQFIFILFRAQKGKARIIATGAWEKANMLLIFI